MNAAGISSVPISKSSSFIVLESPPCVLSVCDKQHLKEGRRQKAVGRERKTNKKSLMSATDRSFLFTVFSLLPSVFCFLPSANCLLPSVY
jgi:hypothetical protein